MAAPRVTISSNWKTASIPLTAARRGRRAGPTAEELIGSDLLEPAGLTIAFARELTQKADGTLLLPETLDLAADAGPDEHYVLALRHESGALTFHAPAMERQRRSAGATSLRRVQFHVTLPVPVAPDGRRGVISKVVKKVVKVVLIKVVRKIVDKAAEWVLSKLASRWEIAAWKKKELSEGVFRVDRAALQGGPMRPARPDDFTPGGERHLLLIHGTFSNAASAFEDLGVATSPMFDDFTSLYGERIFALNHYTVSKTPLDNARALLDALPGEPCTFDVITHSRGGLVLRTLAELKDQLGAPASRFVPGRTTLVASPNVGTPLATPERFEQTIGWLANILEMFPDNPFTLAAEFISEALVWLAQRVPGAAPGIGVMDSNGPFIAALQNAADVESSDYSVLASNYEPTGDLKRRALDVAADAFFATENDLVVPSSGGWLLDPARAMQIPAARVGCFGPGGNLRPDRDEGVWHSSIFAQSASWYFLNNALRGKPQNLPPVDIQPTLPFAARRGGAPALPASVPIAPPPAITRDATIDATPTPVAGSAFTVGEPIQQPPFLLNIMTLDDINTAMLATYGNARVVETFRTRGKSDGAGRRFYDIIRTHERINAIVNGESDEALPDDRELIEYGTTLFNTLFPGDVRRLYDVARSIHPEETLNVILTSMTSWIADKPWEFAFDPSRRTFLATEEIHFTRNVITAVPAQLIAPSQRRLRILVVAAHPIGTGHLSIDEETAVILRGFDALIRAELADVQVLSSTSVGELHNKVMCEQFDVVHFIGHGEYDAQTDRGYLLFEDRNGGVHRVDERKLKEILCQRSIRLVFLNACETGRGGRVDFNRGVAPSLVAGGVPTVIANQYSVLDVSATVFAQSLYWALAQGMSVGSAAKEARVAVNYSISGESIDWAVPVVYTRNPAERLCTGTVPAGATRVRFGGRPAQTTRRGGARRTLQVALWDVNQTLPQLELLIDRLNAAQSHVGFFAAQLSAPLGAWSSQDDGHGDSRYLNVPRVADAMRDQPSALAADYIVGLTSNYLMDRNWLNLTSWPYEPDVARGVIFVSTCDLGIVSDELGSYSVIGEQVGRLLAQIRADVDGGADGEGAALRTLAVMDQA
jgi:hypothetical protein